MSADDCGDAPSSLTSVEPEAGGRGPVGDGVAGRADQPLAAVVGGEHDTRHADDGEAGQGQDDARRYPHAGRAAPPDLPEAGRLFWGLAELLLRALALLRLAPRIAAGIRVLRDPEHQVVEPNAQVSRLLGDERGGRHAGLGVDL